MNLEYFQTHADGSITLKLGPDTQRVSIRDVGILRNGITGWRFTPVHKSDDRPPPKAPNGAALKRRPRHQVNLMAASLRSAANNRRKQRKIAP